MIESWRWQNVGFRMEVFEIADLCNEVIGELSVRPVERFFLCELLVLGSLFDGRTAKDQIMLDWLFDLRRVTADHLEGTVIYDSRTQACKLYRREPIMPGMVYHL